MVEGKALKKILVIFCLLLSFSFVYADDIELTSEEEEWLEDNNRILTLGLDPYTGMDFFEFKGKQQGYVVDLVELIEKSVDLEIEIISDQTWSQVYNGLIDKEIDILFGANITEERLRFMAFTEPVHTYPYAVFVNKYSDIKTLGDMDNNLVGFLEGDIAIELFTGAFENIQYDVTEFSDQILGLNALGDNRIDAFITSGGGIENEFIYNYPDIKLMTQIQDITSDMTLATHKDQAILAGILNKIIDQHSDAIEDYIDSSSIIYNRKLLNLSDAELKWLEEDGVATVGVVEDYLPFDYYKNGQYLGIAGALVEEISNLVGIEFEYVYGSFDDIYQKALQGEVDVLNIAKTNDRLEKFIFPRSFNKERDHIYGHKSSLPVHDIYGLEGKKVAVIEGFWHEEMLKKSLRNVTIIKTESINESLKYVDRGIVDYFIENPTVADYYIAGLGYFDIIKKGDTSADSFLYFGVNKNEEELANIIDKALLIIDYESVKQRGLSSAPKLVRRNVRYLIITIVILLFIISVGIWFLVKAINSLISERETSAALQEREHLMYLDPLTGLNNRLFFNLKEVNLQNYGFPQAIFMFDLNRLKQINDTMGHHVGDIYITAFGDILQKIFEGHMICRMGGDEFLVIMVETNEKVVQEKIANLKDKVNMKITFNEHLIEHVDVAIGYTMRFDQSESLRDKMIEADNAMYVNKKGDR